jgi:hypothetical protein
MGWGTFIAGRLLRDRPPRPSLLQSSSETIQANRSNLEKNILREINYLQSHDIWQERAKNLGLVGDGR